MSATPPPFQMPAPPQARATNSANKTCLIIVLMVFGLIVALCAMGFFVMKGFMGQVTKTASCAMMFNLVHDSAVAYSKEHGGKLPAAETWEKDIAPYYARLHKKIKKEIGDAPSFVEGFLPPAPGSDLQCQWDGRTTGIAYNTDVQGKKVADIKDPEKTVMFYETDKTGKNLAMKYAPLPKSSAPKLMNEQRSWIVYYIEGNEDPLKSSSSSSKSFTVTPDDALTPDDEKGGKSKSGERAA